MPDSLESLDELLLTVPKTRIVHRDGIRFQGCATCHHPGGVRRRSRDHPLRPRDITEIRVFHDNHFLCTAVDIDHEDQTLTLKDIQAARAACRRALRSGLNERIAVVAKYLPAYAPHRAAPTPANRNRYIDPTAETAHVPGGLMNASRFIITRSTAGSSSSPTPSKPTAPSVCASGPPASARPCPRAATPTGTKPNRC